MGRLEGHIWIWPRIYSLCVPYHDVCDFYFSGHLAFACVILCEVFALNLHQDKRKKHNLPRNNFRVFLYVSIFGIVWHAFVVTVTRTHYWIDYPGGICIAFLFTMVAEKLSYFHDVKIVGTKKVYRGTLHYSACPKCGWLN